MNMFKQWFNKLSLKSKWALTASIVIFISYAIICTVIYVSLKTWFMYNEEIIVKRTMDDLMSFFENESHDLTIQQIQRNKGLINEIIEKEQTVRIYNLDGIEILRINDTLSVAPILVDGHTERVVEKQRVDNVEMLVESQPIQLGLFQGYIQVAHPLNAVYASLHYVLTAMLIAGLGALLVSAFIGYGLANVLMRPIEQLRESMKTVKEGGFNVPVRVSNTSNDEIGELLDIYNAMMRELQMVFVQQQQFIADASHELRTPIQALEGHLAMLKRWGKNDPIVLEESLDTSLTEIQRMKKMMEELLELAKREPIDMANASANLKTVCQSVKEELLTVYPNANIQVEMDSSIGEIAITESALGQVLRNLLENAIRYCYGIPYIKLQAEQKDYYVVIMIQDNGIGISANELPYIFDRFYRVDAARNRESGGAGLGLSITKLLVEKYNGTIEVKSIFGEGTNFKIKLHLKK